MRTTDYKPYKVVLLGDTQVGKTSLINRLINDSPPNGWQPTIGCHCFDYKYIIDDCEINIELWDTAGQEMYSSIVPVYTRNSKSALILFSILELSSYDHITKWLNLLNETIPPNTPIYIVGTFQDKEDSRAVLKEHAKDFASSVKAKYFEVSNMTGNGVKELFEDLSRTLLESQNTQTTSNLGIDESKKKSCCSQ